MSEFEEVAERARHKAEAAEEVRDAQLERKRLAIEGYKQKRTRDALAASDVRVIVAVVLFAFFLGFPFFALKSLHVSGSVKMLLLVVSLTLAGVSLIGGLLSGWAAKREIAWLQSLPFHIALAAYFSVLSVQRDSATPQLRISFETAPTDEERQAISLVVNELMPKASTSWSGEQLVIAGPSVSTSNRPSDQNFKSYNNGRIHVWVRRCIRKVLFVVHEAHPISTVYPSA